MGLFLIYFLVTFGMTFFAWLLFGKSITLKEFALLIGGQILLILIICGTIYATGLSDTEILNSYVTNKEREKVSCSHSYDCNCRNVCSNDSNGNSNCHQECDTCYEHSYDVDWVVRDTIGSFEIDRIDRQGLDEPSRWTSVQIGEPTSHQHTYQNFIKADPESLFKTEMTEEEMEGYPTYPKGIYDYYRLDRLVVPFQFKNTVIFKPEWNKRISVINADIGPHNQANLVVVLVQSKGIEYSKKLERAWLGAKKNDVVVVVNTNDEGSEAGIAWAEVIGIPYPDFKVKMRSALIDYNKFDIGMLDVIHKTISAEFKRRPMSEFKYLTDSFTPSTTEFVVGLIFCILITGVGIYFANQEDW